jgi:hypothetical protein
MKFKIVGFDITSVLVTLDCDKLYYNELLVIEL